MGIFNQNCRYLLIILLFAGETVHASGLAALEFLENDSANREYCLTKHNAMADCKAPHTRAVQIRLPDSLGAKIEQHVQHAFERGYAEELSLRDFFHGHLILRGPNTLYDSPESLFADVSAVLYHSSEYTSRWLRQEAAGVPVDERTIRSFVGWPNGDTEPAIDLIAPGVNINGYHRAGTLHTSHLVASIPGLSSHDHWGLGKYEKIEVRVCRGGQCAACDLKTQLYILRDPQGRYRTQDGESFDLYLRCVGGP